MVHPVHYTISVRAEVIGTLCDKGENITEFFTKPGNIKTLVRGIPVQEKGLKK
jgi:hypothetical protein